MTDSLIAREIEQSMQMMRERNEYRKTLTGLVEELREEVMPKMQAIYTRLHGGTDRERDEGHKLWLLHNHLTFVCKMCMGEFKKEEESND
jgi:hypothetical protein